jgi:hypothetical protein
MSKNIYSRLLDAKKSIGKVVKNAKNPHFKNTYADLNALIETVEPILLENGLLLLQPIINGKVVTQIIDVETSEKLESIIELDAKLNAQQQGSQITYYRRYTLQSILSLQAVDDDGQLASTPKQQAKPVINEAQFEKAIERILAGEFDLIAKIEQTYELTGQQALELKSIENLKHE